MTDREKDIQKLCQEIFDIGSDYDNDRNQSYCPFCFNRSWGKVGLKQIDHENNCAYLIAKDLSTGFRNE